MIVGEAYCPSVNMNEMYRLQPALADLLTIFPFALLSALGIAEVIGYTSPLRYVSCLSFIAAVCLTFVALARTGLITGAACPSMLRQQTCYSISS